MADITERVASIETKIEIMGDRLNGIEQTLEDLVEMHQRINGVSWAIVRICALVVGGITTIGGFISGLMWFLDHHVILTLK
jgi:hypothetical protein